MAGYAVAIVVMFLSTCSYLYSAVRLLQCWRIEKTKVEKLEEICNFLVPLISSSSNQLVQGISPKQYGTIPNSPIDPHTPPPNLLIYLELSQRAFGRWAVFVQFGIAAMQFGVCLMYFIFVPQNMVESVRALSGVEVNKVLSLLLMVAIEVPLSWIQDI